MIGRKKRKYKRRKNTREFDPESWQLGSETKRTLLIIGLFTFAILGLISLFNGAGALGEWIQWGMGRLFGWADWLVLLLLIVLAYFLLFDEKYQFKKINYIGLFVLWISVTGLLDYFVHDQTLTEIVEAGKGGGYLGYGIGHNLIKFAGFAGGLIILIGLLLTSVFIFFNTSFRQIIERVRDFQDGFSGSSEDELEEGDYLDEEEEESEYVEEEDEEEEPSDDEEEDEIDDEDKAPAKESPGRTYKRMKRIEIPLDLLTPSSGKPSSGDIKANSEKIQKTLENFGIAVEMDDINVGPTVTQYTFKPAEGVKLSRITALQNDIALALAAHPIRIEAPIPGKSLVGIEVPNQAVSIVRIKDVINSDVFRRRKSNLMISLGKDVTGKAIMADLVKMPHLLIAGATGSGKSVAINTIITSLLWQNSPSDLKFIMVDPKRVELSTYNDIPHLLTPVITESKATINALRWVVNEMDERYKLLAAAGKRNIESYNKALKNNRLPYMVVVIDELADLMAVAAKEVEAAIIRLAQMARAVGIHLILATQRPSVNVITGLIKANITSRIAFAVASSTDSRTILDISGAEKLLGNGDMLYTSAELSKPRRIQGAFISEKEVNAITNFLKEEGGDPDYNMEVAETATKSGGFGGGIDGDEEDLGIATDIIVKAGRASATLLQSRMRIGFAKAARLLDLLEERGIVGPAQGSKPRDVLVTEEDLKNNFDPQPQDDYEDEVEDDAEEDDYDEDESDEDYDESEEDDHEEDDDSDDEESDDDIEEDEEDYEEEGEDEEDDEEKF